MFHIDDTIIHPGYGVGTVVGIEKLQCLGSNKSYYLIELLDESKSHVWVPVRDAGKRGVRHLTPLSQLNQIWCILRAKPETLSTDHEKRHQSLQEKLRGGDIFHTAEVVRDIFWDDYHSSRQTILGKKLYDRGLMLLTGEIAAMRGCELDIVKAEVSSILGTSLAAGSAG